MRKKQKNDSFNDNDKHVDLIITVKSKSSLFISETKRLSVSKDNVFLFETCETAKRGISVDSGAGRGAANRVSLQGATEIAGLDIVGRSGKSGHYRTGHFRTGLAGVDNDGRPTDWRNLACYRCCGSVGK